jgi:hypothetical protein
VESFGVAPIPRIVSSDQFRMQIKKETEFLGLKERDQIPRPNFNGLASSNQRMRYNNHLLIRWEE